MDADIEFQRQVVNLVGLGYPALAGMGATEFRDLVEPLRVTARSVDAQRAGGSAYHVGFVIVVARELVAPEVSVPLLTLPGKKKGGVVDRNYKQGELARFVPLEDLPITSAAYLIVDVERGEEFCDVKPVDATATIKARGRTPLTIEEGIALATHFPDALEKNKCFMLAGSRCGDKRVPALWISENAPKLGWCWNGNPHTWLGTASCGSRVTARTSGT
ncbi:DUF5701 family protein [Luedemannella flava]|uniref:DUF5701 family protein n=1 Tax=Luedemannella flava TaxID=349316 RepID=A0ABN2MG85_9ACTN